MASFSSVFSTLVETPMNAIPQPKGLNILPNLDNAGLSSDHENNVGSSLLYVIKVLVGMDVSGEGRQINI